MEIVNVKSGTLSTSFKRFAAMICNIYIFENYKEFISLTLDTIFKDNIAYKAPQPSSRDIII